MMRDERREMLEKEGGILHEQWKREERVIRRIRELLSEEKKQREMRLENQVQLRKICLVGFRILDKAHERSSDEQFLLLH
jgi:hypothetical protein